MAKKDDFEINWKQILFQLVMQAVPVIIKIILDWLKGASRDDVVAVAKNAGEAAKAVKKAYKA